MKLNPSEQESLIALLTRIYTDIREVEEAFNLRVGEGDFRVRIEYFHDAVRAFSSLEPRHQEPGGRLAVELLAYDLSCLRYVQSMPLASFKPHGVPQSAGTAVMPVGKDALALRPKRPDRAARERISELYEHYAVLFAALLKPMADRDYHARTDNLNQDVQDIHDVIQQLEALAKGQGSLEKLAAAVQHLEDGKLRRELMEFMQAQQHKKKEKLTQMVQYLKQQSAQKDKEIAAIDAAHMNYAVAQLGIFEGARDMLKKLASQGMNLVGKFVEKAVAESRREMGR